MAKKKENKLDKETKENLVLELRQTIFGDFKSKYWLTKEETMIILREVYDRALIGIT